MYVLTRIYMIGFRPKEVERAPAFTFSPLHVEAASVAPPRRRALGAEAMHMHLHLDRHARF